jgi:hypothetical protein
MLWMVGSEDLVVLVLEERSPKTPGVGICMEKLRPCLWIYGSKRRRLACESDAAVGRERLVLVGT